MKTNSCPVGNILICSLLALICILPVPLISQAVQTDVPALKDVFAGDFTIGCLLSYKHVGFSTDPYVPGQSAIYDPRGGVLIGYHMNSMSPGNNMKPVYTVDINASAAAYSAASAQDKDSADMHPVIRFNGDIIAQLNWAERQGFTFRGHTLVWHNQTPASFFRSGYKDSGARLSREKMTERMDHFIGEVIRQIHEGWPGLLSAMDVVNEAVDDNGYDRTTGEWHITFGDNSYLMKAFEITRKYTELYGETQIKLYYNDYNTHKAAKADGIVRICTPIFQAGYLDGIGMQEHDDKASPTASQWIASYNKFEPICTEMAVTELDVTAGSDRPSSTVLEEQANQYGQLFKCFVERSYYSGRGKIINVSKDGLNDASTFKTNQSSSLWTGSFQCKPAFYAVVDVGNAYNTLAERIPYAENLVEAEYTAESWTGLTAALSFSKEQMEKNYSTSVSAADALILAADSLEAVIGRLEVTTGIGCDPICGSELNRPDTYALSQNTPNPFNPTTRIRFSIPQGGFVSLKVYDILGNEAASLTEGVQTGGDHTVVFDGSSLASGVYLYRLEAEGMSISKKMFLLK